MNSRVRAVTAAPAASLSDRDRDAGSARGTRQARGCRTMTMFTEAVDALTGARRREADDFAALLDGGRARPARQRGHGVAGRARAGTRPGPALARPRVPRRAARPAGRRGGSPRARRGARAARRRAVAPRRTRWRTAVATARRRLGRHRRRRRRSEHPGPARRRALRPQAAASSRPARPRRLRPRPRPRAPRAGRPPPRRGRGASRPPSTAGQPETRRDLAATLTEMEAATTAGADALNASYARHRRRGAAAAARPVRHRPAASACAT